MIRQHPLVGRTAVWALACTAMLLWACDQELPTLNDAGDISVEITVDTSGDVPVETTPDVAPDTLADPTVDTGDCIYPTGPYAFSAVGNTVGPMTWPTAVAGTDETLAADLRALHCDPSVKSIFIQIAALS